VTAVPAVETRDLVKIFERGRRTIWRRLRREPDKRDRFCAVDGIDLIVEPGEIFGLLCSRGRPAHPGGELLRR
jgi:ABC-type multidrug transport system ATPase subunit